MQRLVRSRARNRRRAAKAKRISLQARMRSPPIRLRQQPSPTPDPVSRPPISRMSPKAAPPSSETARAAAGKRAPTKSAPLAAARPSTPMAAAKPPASRFAKETPRTSPTVIGLNASPGSALPSAEAPRVEHAHRDRAALAPGAAAGPDRARGIAAAGAAACRDPCAVRYGRHSVTAASVCARTRRRQPRQNHPPRRARAVPHRPAMNGARESATCPSFSGLPSGRRRRSRIERLHDAPTPAKPSRAPQAPSPLPDPPVPATAKSRSAVVGIRRACPRLASWRL